MILTGNEYVHQIMYMNYELFTKYLTLSLFLYYTLNNNIVKLKVVVFKRMELIDEY